MDFEQLTELLDQAESAGRQPEDPTPEEIHLACLRIRENWTEEERQFRAGMRDSWLGRTMM